MNIPNNMLKSSYKLWCVTEKVHGANFSFVITTNENNNNNNNNSK